MVIWYGFPSAPQQVMPSLWPTDQKPRRLAPSSFSLARGTQLAGGDHRLSGGGAGQKRAFGNPIRIYVSVFKGFSLDCEGHGASGYRHDHQGVWQVHWKFRWHPGQKQSEWFLQRKHQEGWVKQSKSKLWQKSSKTRKRAQLVGAKPFSNLLLSQFFFMVRPFHTEIFLLFDLDGHNLGTVLFPLNPYLQPSKKNLTAFMFHIISSGPL